MANSVSGDGRAAADQEFGEWGAGLAGQNLVRWNQRSTCHNLSLLEVFMHKPWHKAWHNCCSLSCSSCQAEEPLLLEHFHCSTPIVATWMQILVALSLFHARIVSPESSPPRHCIGTRSWASSAFRPLAMWWLLIAVECKPFLSMRPDQRGF